MLLNQIWVLQSQLTNYFYPQQKLISKDRDGAKVTKKYDNATTPHRRADQPRPSPERTRRSSPLVHAINPAAVQRQIQALTTELIALATQHTQGAPLTRALLDESTNRLRGHLDMRQHEGLGLVSRAEHVAEQSLPQVEFSGIAVRVIAQPVHHVPEPDTGVRIGEPERTTGTAPSICLAR